MHLITVRNVEEALIRGTDLINSNGDLRDSRNGPVKVMPMPVTTMYENPRERVILLPGRDANPFFHFMECLWMMAGRNDVEWISQFNGGIANYSDDGVTFHGAYGYRWRNHFDDPISGDVQYGDMALDQLATIAAQLRTNPDDRRTVLQMWDARVDLGLNGKDFPCNLIITFRINSTGHLDMTVFNRSNDMIWGAYGANAVHMSFLQEVMASWIGVPVGRYWQVSTNFHAYLNTLEKISSIGNSSPDITKYQQEIISPFPIVNGSIDEWFEDLSMFMDEGPVMGYRDKFFKKVAVPMLMSWNHWKNKEDPEHIEKAIDSASDIQATDWRLACTEWLERRT
jgi:thymidylate synthase